MSPEDCRPGMRVWYEPSTVGGVRFLGTVDEAPRQLGSSWVVRVVMATAAYGEWRLRGGDGVPRSTVPAASLDSIYPDVPLPPAMSPGDANPAK